MELEIKKVLKKLEQNGYEAYIIGGFVRDCLLSRPTNDVDIATNALPKEIQMVFGGSKEISTYGSYNLKTKHYNFDITTYREEKEYENRRPISVIYTSNLLKDLQRRDFTINAICMNQKGKIIDLVNGVADIEAKIIRSIGEPEKKIKEDPLRILRAIRFSCILDFTLDEKLAETINHQKNLMLNLSNYRIKKELDSLLLSKNFQKGLDLLDNFGILKLLEITPGDITYVNDINGMWAQFQKTKDFGFTKVEKKQIEKIKEILKKEEITPSIIYNYGIYSSMVAAKIKHMPEKKITNIIRSMPIQTYQDVKISFERILEITNLDPKKAKELQAKMIEKILNKTLKNKKESLEKFLKEETNEI